MAIYRLTDVGLHDAWRSINDASPTTNLSGVGKGFPGMAWAWQGNIYQYVQNRSGGALTEGMATSLYYGAAARIGNLTGDSTKAVLVTDDTIVGELMGVHEWPGYVFLTAGTSIGERRQIRDNSNAAGASTITVSEFNREAGPVGGLATTQVDAYGTLPDATSDYSVICPWEVTSADASALGTSRLQGVVVSTSITDTYFGVIQVKGLAIASVNGTTDLVKGDSLVVSTDVGELIKWVITDANATTIAAEIAAADLVAGFILDDYATNSAGRRHVWLNGRNAVYPELVTW